MCIHNFIDLVLLIATYLQRVVQRSVTQQLTVVGSSVFLYLHMRLQVNANYRSCEITETVWSAVMRGSPYAYASLTIPAANHELHKHRSLRRQVAGRCNGCSTNPKSLETTVSIALGHRSRMPCLLFPAHLIASTPDVRVRHDGPSSLARNFLMVWSILPVELSSSTLTSWTLRGLLAIA